MPEYITPGVYIEEVPSGIYTIPGVDIATTAFIGKSPRGPLNTSTLVTSHADFVATFGEELETDPLSLAVYDFFMHGGLQAYIVRVAELGDETGLHALAETEFSLLCLTPDTHGVDVPIAGYQDAARFCYKHRAFLLIDPPEAWQRALPGRIGDLHPDRFGITGVEARNAAVYFPALKRTIGGREIVSGPAGAVAGIIASIDYSYGVWKAPAGTEAILSGDFTLAHPVNDIENGILNARGINVLRMLPVFGNVVWGARTLRGSDMLADDYKYVNVRRLALYIEESLYRGLQWAVFEPNDEPLWAQIRQSVGNFLDDLFREGAFRGATSDRVYFVKCDSSTTSSSDIQNGVINVLVGFAPLKPAEFVIINIRLRGAT